MLADARSESLVSNFAEQWLYLQDIEQKRPDDLMFPDYDETLQVARAMTQRLGNRGMTVALGKAQDELRSGRTISIGTRKTIKLGARTQTMKVGTPDDVPQNVPSQEEIRRLTGA